jgi:hypothetical protein
VAGLSILLTINLPYRLDIHYGISPPFALP